MNKETFLDKKGQSLEIYVKNSIPLSALLQNEKDGLGGTTISELLNVLQDLHESGQTEEYSILSGRNKI